MAAFSDTFDGSGALSANWDNLNNTDPTRVSGELVSVPNATEWNFIVWQTPCDSLNQFSEVRFDNTNCQAGHPLIVRNDNTFAFFGAPCYTMQVSNSGTELQLRKHTSAANTVLDTHSLASTPLGYHTYRIEARDIGGGSTELKGFFDGTEYLSAVDSTSPLTGMYVGISAGFPGGSGYAKWDDFVAGDLAPAGDINLVVANAVHSVTSNTVALSVPVIYAYTELEWSIGVQAPAADGDVYEFRVFLDDLLALDSYAVTPQLTVAPAEAGIGLVVANTTHVHSAGAVVAAIDLIVGNAAHAHSSGVSVLAVDLVVGSATHLQTTGTAVVAVDLVVSNATHLQTTGATVVAVDLVVGNATHLHVTGATVVAVDLVVGNAVHLQLAGSFAAAVDLVVANAAHAQTSGAPVVTFDLVVTPSVHAHTAGAVVATFDLVVAGTAHLHTAGAVVLTPLLVTASAVHFHDAQQIALNVGGIDLVIPSVANHGHIAGEFALAISTHVLVVASAIHAHSAGTVDMAGVTVLNTALALFLGNTAVTRVYAGSVQVWP